MKIEQQLESISMQKSAIIGMVLMGIYYFVLYNDGSALESRIKTAEQQERKVQAELIEVENRRKEALRIKAALSDIGKRLDDLVKFLPSTLRSSDFMKMLSDEAQAAGINILSIDDLSAAIAIDQSTPEEGSEYFVKIPVRVKLEGTYVGLLTFLSNLTKIDKIILLSDIEITRSVTQGGTKPDPAADVMLTLQGKVVAFRYNEPEPEPDNTENPGG
ncbi:MAG: type 4a pilus biogenesis protein PilO [Bdellovibrionales bacterium]|nr:type 4a pilus biogenesis protein PilO [Bdellovibrionales bacterium]